MLDSGVPTVAQQPADDGDWLSKLGSAAVNVGSFAGSFMLNVVGAGGVVADNKGDLSDSLKQVTENVMKPVGSVFGAISDKEPTNVISAPARWAAHTIGVGKPGDEWDKGILGLIGTGFEKGGRLAAYGALTTTQDSFTDAPAFMKPGLNKQSWDLAFSKDASVDFGAGMLAEQTVLTTPNGVSNLHKQMDSTWWANPAAVGLDLVMYSAIDPTKGVSKVARAGRAASYVTDAGQADRLASVMNKARPVDESAVIAGLDGSKAGDLGNTARALVGAPLNDEAQVGHLMKSANKNFYGDTDFNSIMNKLDPMVGNGVDATRATVAKVAEMVQDAGSITDPVLHAQAVSNVFLSLAQSDLSKTWLAENYPMIAAKGRRISTAPSEFTLMRDVLDEASKNGLQNLDIGAWVDSQYGSAPNMAEIEAYGRRVEQVRSFQQTLAHGASDGMPVSFAGREGTLLAPRSLELLKTALNQRIYSSHLIQGGPSGRTIRVINSFVTPVADGNRIHVADPVMGNKQLMGTLRTFNLKLKSADGPDIISPEYVQATSEAFLKAPTAAARGVVIDGVSDKLIGLVAEKYGPQAMFDRGEPLTPENVRQMTQLANSARGNATAYLKKKVEAAKAKGSEVTWTGDLGGSDAVWGTAQLQSQLENTHFLWDWKRANEAVDGFYVNNRVMAKTGLSRGDRAMNSTPVAMANWYMQMWKHGVLLRPGLAPRAILDTGVRAEAVNGSLVTGLQLMNGVSNLVRNTGRGLLGRDDLLNMTALDRAGVTRADDVIRTLRGQNVDAQARLTARAAAEQRAGGLEESFTAKTRLLAGDPKVAGDAATPGAVTGIGTGGLPYTKVTAADLKVGDRVNRGTPTIGTVVKIWSPEGNAKASSVLVEFPRKTKVPGAEMTPTYQHTFTSFPDETFQRYDTEVGATAPASRVGGPRKAGQFHELTGYYRALAARAAELTDRVGNGPGAIGSGGVPFTADTLAAAKRSLVKRYVGLGDTVKVAERKAGKALSKTDMLTKGDNIPTSVQAVLDADRQGLVNRGDAIDGLMKARAQYLQGSVAGKRRGATTPFQVDAEGRKVGPLRRAAGVTGSEWAAARGEMDYQTQVAEMLAGGSASNIFGVSSVNGRMKGLRSDPSRGSGDVAPDDAFWPQKYVLTAAKLRDSYTARRLLTERESLVGPGRTPQAVENSFLNDPRVEAEFRSVFPGDGYTRHDARQWLATQLNSVDSMAPNEAALKMLSGPKPVTEQMAAAITDRFPIFGPDVFRDQSSNMTKFIDTAYHVLLNTPDVALARVPMYRGLYEANIRDLVPRYMVKVKAEGRSAFNDQERRTIHSEARQRSLNDTRRDMYDANRVTGAASVMQVISPFYAPWLDAMTSWSRLIYEDPARLGHLMRATQTPDVMGLTLDKDGNPTRPFDGTAMADKSVQIPLTGILGMKPFRVNEGSFNSIQQGSVPWSPGAGPLVQLSSTALVADVLPHITAFNIGPNLWQAIASNPDNLINKTVLPQGDVPKAGTQSLLMSQLPSWGRKFIEAVASNDEHSFGSIYPAAFATRYGDLIVEYRTANGGRDPSKAELLSMQDTASKGARVAAITSSAFSFGLGLSGNAAVQGQLYVDKMHALNAIAPTLATQGLTPAGVFASMYPQASNLNWAFSVNEGKLVASVDSTTSYMKNRALMDANPTATWWIAGPDNIMANLGNPDIAGKSFSQSAYNQQMNAGLRRQYTQKELVQQQDIAMGYGAMAAFDAQVGLTLRRNGIKSLQSKEAAGLRVYKAEFVTNLQNQHPDWADDVNTMDYKKRQHDIQRIQVIAFDPPASLKNRPDVVTTAKYLFARKLLADNAQREFGVSSWQTSNKLQADRQSLRRYGESLAASDIVFQQAWSRLFEGEFKADLVSAVGNP